LKHNGNAALAIIYVLLTGNIKLMHRNITIVLIGLLISFMITDDLLAKSPNSVLKGLKKRYKKIETLQADFREIFEWAMTGEKIQREGNLIVTDDNRFRINTPEQLLVCDGQSVYRHNRERNQIIIEPVNASNNNMLPQRLMLQFADEFKATKTTELAVDGRAGVRLDLISNAPDEVLISEATVWLTIDDNIVHRLKFDDLNGNTTTYFFSNIQINQPIDITLITFTPPEDAEVFDLR